MSVSMHVESGLWLNAVPVTSLGTMMTNNEQSVAGTQRIEAPVRVKHKCKCGLVVNENGYHELACKHLRIRISDRNEMRCVAHSGCGSAHSFFCN